MSTAGQRGRRASQRSWSYGTRRERRALAPEQAFGAVASFYATH